MAVNYITMSCAPDAVFRVLADGWLYAGWVVGASRIRAVDDDWPAPQALVHHSFGVWPVVINDTTYLQEWDPPRHLTMRARGWPMGEANIAIDVKKRANGCVVRISEDAVEGPGKLVPKFIRDIGLWYRNTETLRRLRWLAEGGAGR